MHWHTENILLLPGHAGLEEFLWNYWSQHMPKHITELFPVRCCHLSVAEIPSVLRTRCLVGVFFFFFLSSSSLLWRYCLQDPFKLTANYTLITSLPIPGIYSHLLSKCCILKYFALILPQILSITKILSFPWRHCSLSRSKAGNMSLVNTRW